VGDHGPRLPRRRDGGGGRGADARGEARDWGSVGRGDVGAAGADAGEGAADYPAHSEDE
ncbi:hypothetical protein V493_07787, partial [Pseudogymnoascus sp. VKM F-4281 (FW-2241)]